jgi:uncharacterized membrane protein YkvA (DUF1232 family)
VPRQGKLAYCLLRDERVPPAPKGALLGALALIVSPVDVPAWIPVAGELDMLALGVLAIKVFVEACPEDLVAEHEARIRAGRSTFEQDLRTVAAFARSGVVRLLNRMQAAAPAGGIREAVSGG